MTKEWKFDLSDGREKFVERLLKNGTTFNAPLKCSVCGKRPVVRIENRQDAEGLAAWLFDKVRIQVALPHWSPGRREELLSGTHGKCFDDLFAGSE